MKNTLSLLALSVALTLPLTAAPQQQPKGSDARSRDLYVSVVDREGNAAKGLTVADFEVREDGVSREVLKVAPADEPLQIVLLVDDSQAATSAIPFMRDALTAFVDRMAGKAEIGIVTVGERPTSVAERTTSAATAKKGVTRIFARPGSGAYLLEGIVEVSRGLQKREATRPVIIALTVEGVEFSNQQHERVVKELLASGAAFHVLAIGSPADASSDEMRQRALVLAQGTEQTGGRHDQLISNMAIGPALSKLADELLNQYRVTYARPDALVPPERVQVTVTKQGLTARARTRLPAVR